MSERKIEQALDYWEALAADLPGFDVEQEIGEFGTVLNSWPTGCKVHHYKDGKAAGLQLDMWVTGDDGEMDVPRLGCAVCIWERLQTALEEAQKEKDAWKAAFWTHLEESGKVVRRKNEAMDELGAAVNRNADSIEEAVRQRDSYKALAERRKDGPPVVCLCGSTRFMDAFNEVGWQKTLDGEIVLSVGVSKYLPSAHGAEFIGQEVADALDELHKRKIDLADYVMVLNVGGYIGDSTRSEIEYAEAQGKRVDYLEARAAVEEES